MVARIISVCCMLLLVPFFAEAQVNQRGVTPEPEKEMAAGTTRALVIGISKYQNIASLRYADNDALAFYHYLTSDARNKIDSANIRVLLNEKAKQGDVFRELEWLVDNSRPNDLSIIYFAGHGDVETKTVVQNGFLLAYDTPKSCYYAGGTIQVENLKAYVTTMALNNVKVIVISDACRSGTLAGGTKGVELTMTALKEQWKNEIKILSCYPGELSQEGSQWGNGRGVFSYYLVKGLMGLADRDKDGSVTAYELQSYVYDNVKAETHPVKQTPSISGDLNAILSKTDPRSLAMLEEEEKSPQHQLLARLEMPRGSESLFVSDVDSSFRLTYSKFEEALDSNRLIEPKNDCAFRYFQELLASNNEKLIKLVRRNLGAALQNDAQQVINSYITHEGKALRDLSFTKASEKMDIALNLLGEGHPLYHSYKARQLFLEARGYFNSHNRGLKRKAIALLERSIAIEPQAAYSFNALGGLYEHLDEFGKAVQFYRKALNLAPTWALPYNNIWGFFSSRGFSDSANIYGEKAMDRDSTDSIVLNSHGVALIDQRNYGLARWYLTKALRYDSALNYPYRNLSRIFREQGNDPAADSVLWEGIKKSDDKANLFAYLGWQFEDRGRLDSAGYYYRRAVTEDSTSVDSYVALMRVCDAIVDTAKRDAYYQKCKEYDAALANNEMGWLYQDQDQERAKTFYLASIAADSDYCYPYFNLALIILNSASEDPEALLRAVGYLKKSVDSNPYQASYYDLLVRAYARLSNDANAVEWYLKRFDIQPPAPHEYYPAPYDSATFFQALGLYMTKRRAGGLFHWSYVNMAYLCSYAGQYDSSLAYFDHAFSQDSTLLKTWSHKAADICERKGDHSKAQELYELSIKLNHGEREEDFECLRVSISNEVLELNKSGKSQQAVTVLRRHSERYLDDAKYLRLLGYSYLFSGDKENSLSSFLKALEIGGSSNPSFFYDLAFYYSRIDKSAEALRWLQKAWEWKPPTKFSIKTPQMR